VDAGRVQEIVRVLRGYTEKVFQIGVIENRGLEEVMEILDLQSRGLEGTFQNTPSKQRRELK
jgi:hypothetical protein